MGRNSKERTNHGDNQPDSHDPHGQSRLRSRTQAHGRRQDRVNFRVAQTSVTEKNGKWEDGETTFIRCVAYGILADHMIASGIRKGTRVIVSGRYVQRDWQTETGERRSSYELNVDDLGASVRYATVQITKATANAGMQHAPLVQPQQQTAQLTNDPWPTATQDQFAEPQEPAF